MVELDLGIPWSKTRADDETRKTKQNTFCLLLEGGDEKKDFRQP